jgi:hypothetical protein
VSGRSSVEQSLEAEHHAEEGKPCAIALLDLHFGEDAAGFAANFANDVK